MTCPELHRSEAFAEDLPGWGMEPLALRDEPPPPTVWATAWHTLLQRLAQGTARAVRKRPRGATLQRA